MLGVGALLLSWVMLAPEAPPRTPQRIALTWNAPGGCASAAEVERRIAALLSGPPQGEGEAVVIADVSAGADEVRMVLSTTFDGMTDVRTVTSQSCETLADTTALLLAISLEPGLDAAEPEPAPEPEPEPRLPTVEPPPPTRSRPAEPEPAPAPVVVSAEPADPEPQPRPLDLRAWLGLGGGMEWGGLRDPTGAAAATLGLGGEAWRVRAHGTYLMPLRADGGLYQGGGAGLRGCWTPGGSRWGGELCGGAEAGALRVDTRGARAPTTRQGPSIGPLASAGVRVSLGRWELFGNTEVFTPIRRSRATSQGTTLLEPRAVSVRLSLGVRVGLELFR